MSNKMWGGRFSERPDEIMEEINVSIDVDQHLYAQDIAASKAHAAMLAAQGIITANDAKNITSGLDTILSEIEQGSFDFKRALEDILIAAALIVVLLAFLAGGVWIAEDIRLFQESIDQGGLAVVDVRDDRDVANVHYVRRI